jgi:hypothetical protein
MEIDMDMGISSYAGVVVVLSYSSSSFDMVYNLRVGGDK